MYCQGKKRSITVCLNYHCNNHNHIISNQCVNWTFDEWILFHKSVDYNNSYLYAICMKVRSRFDRFIFFIHGSCIAFHHVMLLHALCIFILLFVCFPIRESSSLVACSEHTVTWKIFTYRWWCIGDVLCLMWCKNESERALSSVVFVVVLKGSLCLIIHPLFSTYLFALILKLNLPTHCPIAYILLFKILLPLWFYVRS